MNLQYRADPVARARAVGPAIVAAADEIERTRRIPEPLLGALHEARLFRLLLPRVVGGEEVEPGVYLRAVEEVARCDGSVGWNMFVGNSSSLLAPYYPLETAREIYADPRSVVAWGPPNQYRAHAVPGGYRVSGRWEFASGCRQANWMGAHCLVEEADGSLRLNRWGKPTIRSLIFPVAQAELLDTWHTIGLRGTASDSYEVRDLFVPEAFSATREDPGLPRLPGKLFSFTQQGLYAVGVAGVALGIAGAMLDAFVALAREKTPRGYVRLADSGVIQDGLARARAKLDAGRAYALCVLAEVYDAADETTPIGLEDRARVRLVCAHAIQNAIEVADFVYKEAGVSAIFPGVGPFERRFRDIHTLSQQIQSRGAHFQAVGSILMGNEPEGIFY
jgi:alkylation response protein AidB-like acyl-CoA dehydrogenase